MARLRAFFGNPATLLFATAVVLLILLSSWWYVFLGRAVDNEFQLLRSNTLLEARLLGQDVDSQQVIAKLEALDERRQRREFMIFGEGLLLSGLLLAVVGMLYRLVRSERRFREEMAFFMRRVTHEMKTPIAGIKAVLQTIQMGRVPAEQLPALAGRALHEAEREEHLIQNLLLSQRLRQPGAVLSSEEIDLGGLVRELIRSRIAMHSAVDWHVDGPERALASGDPGAVRTVLDNLLDNAAKYGGGEVRIELAAHGDEIALTVADIGLGFPPDKAEALFAAFARNNDSRAVARNGTGLGLSIARALADKMSGSLVASSDGPGQGARFKLTLPTWQG